MGLLDAGFEKVGGLEEDGGGETGAETCCEVEYCFGCWIETRLVEIGGASLGTRPCLHLEVPGFTCGTAYAPLFDMTDFGSELRRLSQRQWFPYRLRMGIDIRYQTERASDSR